MPRFPRHSTALALVAFGLGLTACSQAVPVPFQSTSPADVRLRSSDLPSGMKRCRGSGDVAGYLASLKQESKTAQQQNTREWKTLEGRGASSGDVEVYTSDPHACSGAFASDPHARAVFSYVVKYKDSKSASKSFSAGFLGLQPRQGQQAPGLSEGDATGLGSKSWSYTQTKGGTSVFLAYWQQKDFTIFLGTTNLGAADSQKAAVAMNGRVS